MLLSSMKLLFIAACLVGTNSQIMNAWAKLSAVASNQLDIADKAASKAIQEASANIQQNIQQEALGNLYDSDGTLVKANCSWKEPAHYRECFPEPDWTHPDPDVIDIIPIGETDVFVWWAGLWKTIIAAENDKDGSAISALANLPKRYVRWAKKYSRQDLNRMAKKPIRDQLYPDNREYYWQVSCRHKLYRVGGLVHKIYGKCWILWPFHDPIVLAKCMQETCTTRCTYLKPWQKISKCFETHYKDYGYYPKRYMYCPDWYKKWNKPDPCKKKPWMCYVPMPPFKGPKCCECIHCRYYWHPKDFTSADAQTQEFDRTQGGEPQPPLGGEGGDSGSGSVPPPMGGEGGDSGSGPVPPPMGGDGGDSGGLGKDKEPLPP